MICAPKPTKEDRIRAKETKKRDLRDYRDAQYVLAKQRDAGYCVVCFFLHNKLRQASQVHHVYSRGRAAGDWREHHENLMCVCSLPGHHPLPIQFPGGSANLSWVEDLRKAMNDKPIKEQLHGRRGSDI
jgi:hypothetical protein